MKINCCKSVVLFLALFLLVFLLGAARAVEYGDNITGTSGLYTNTDNITASEIAGDNASVGTYGVYGINVDNLSFHNTSDGSISAQSTIGDVTDGGSYSSAATGVYLSNNVTSFNNEGNISAISEAGSSIDGYLTSAATGVFSDADMESFSNSGDIFVNASIGDNNDNNSGNSINVEGVSGIYMTGSVDTFLNSGNISVTAEGGNGIGSQHDYSHVYVNNLSGAELNTVNNYFNNTGTISVEAKLGFNEGYYNRNGIGRIYGVNSSFIGGDFSNSGTIAVKTETGDTNSFYYGTSHIYDIYGAEIGGTVGLFNNSGEISVNALTGDANGYNHTKTYIDDAYGVELNDLNTFENSGSIGVSAQTGNANDNYTNSYINSVKGVYIDYLNDSFSNSGDILVSALTGSANGHGSDVYVRNVYGIDSYSGSSFNNSGLVDVNVKTGNADNVYAQSSISNVSGVSVYGVDEFVNSGDIVVSAEAGSANDNDTNVSIDSVSGASVWGDAGSVNVNNSGNVSVSAASGDANGYSSVVESYDVKGTVVWGNVGEYNNSGNIMVENIVGNANGDSSMVSTFSGAYSGIASASRIGSPENAGTYGVYIGNNVDVDTFVNSGNIEASVKAGGAIGDNSEIYAGHVLGVDIGSDMNIERSLPNAPILQIAPPPSSLHVGSFENSGLISASAEAGDAAGERSMVNVFTANSAWIDYSKVFNFTNSGTMISHGSAGSATGVDSMVGLTDLGMGFLGEVGNFTNEGTILTEVSAGNADGIGSASFIGFPYAMVGGNFTNQASLKAIESPYLSFSPVYGVLFDDTLYNFENSGTIAVSAEAGSATDNNSFVVVQGVLGVMADVNLNTENIADIGNFVNDGNISVEVKTGSASGYDSRIDVSGIFGFGTGFYMDNFTNIGTISVNAVAGDASGVESGVDLGGAIGVLAGSGEYGGNRNFTNEGLISVSSLAGNASADNSSVGIERVAGTEFDTYSSLIDNFENSGDIAVDAKLGNAEGYNTDVVIEDVAGNIFSSKVNDFTNSGSISVNAVTGNASGVDSGAGIGGVSGVLSNFSGSRVTFSDLGPTSDEGIKNFTNSGIISVNAQSGNAAGENSESNVYGIFGGEMDSYTDNFANSGTILTNAETGNASGNNSAVNVSFVGGLNFEMGVKNAENTGSILVSAKAGDASGDNSTINIEEIVGTYLGGDSAFANNGHIGVSVSGGKGSKINNVSGILISDVSEASIDNNGLISVNIDAAQANSVDNVSGIYVMYSPGDTVNISNTGMISLWSNASEADSDIRTLRIGEESSVRLQDKFAITFGQMGVYDRPIYMDNNSMLDLNNAGLIARTGTDLSFNSPYYLIENDNGTVTGEFGQLYKGFTNPEIGVSWYDSNRGEDSGVVFDYNPRNSTPSLGIKNTDIIADSIFDRIISGSSFSGGMFASGTKVYYAQAKMEKDTATDAGSSLGYLSGDSPRENKDAVYLYPFYETTKGDDLAYDSTATGLVLGYEKGIGDRLRLGVFGGYAKGNIDFNVQGADEEDQSFYSLGITFDRLAGYGSPWYFGLKAMAYRTNHDYNGYTGPAYELTEDADYDSNGLKGRMTLGYRIAGSDWEIMPNVGAGITRWKLDSFTTDASDSVWDKHYSSETNSYATLTAGVSGEKNWKTAGNNRFYMGTLVRLEQVVGDNDISVDQELANLNSGKVKVEQDISDFSVVGKVELGIEISKRYSFSVIPGIKLNSDYKSYSGQAVFRLRF